MVKSGMDDNRPDDAADGPVVSEGGRSPSALSPVRGELGLVNMDILWSGALLVLLIVLRAITPRKERANRKTACPPE